MATAREDLTSRQIPHMILSDGTSSSATVDPKAPPRPRNSEEKAQDRFAVRGNAVVTGGAGALALTASRALLEHGLSGLWLFDVSDVQIQKAIEALRTDFPSATIMGRVVNVRDEHAVTKAIAEAALTGSLDILLCFAGVVGCTHAVEMTAEEWRRTLDINTTGSFLCAQAMAKVMIEQGTGGSIVLIASISAHRVNFPQPQIAYNVSKAALLTMKSSLAAEWARFGIRVNSLSPGYMDTILNEGKGLEEARTIWTSRNPMGRMGMPSELSGPIVLLCSPAGSYVNGADILVDGGATVF